jgi:serpin B
MCILIFQKYLFANPSESVNKFAFDLYKKLPKQGNMMFSPLSISSCLAMLYGGAKGESEKELSKVLYFTYPQDSFHISFAKNCTSLMESNKDKKRFLNVSNSMWVHYQYGVEKPFYTLVEKVYHAKLFIVNFKNPENVRKRINSWVRQETNNKIPELISIGSPSASDRFLMVNTVYFKAAWRDVFKKKDTDDFPFITGPGSHVISKMMYRKGYYNFYKDSLISALFMPYSNSSFTLLAILPTDNFGLAYIENRISLEMVNSICASMKNKEVIVRFPKFKFSSNYFLTSDLVTLGLSNTFSNNADFSGISANKSFSPSDVIHSTFIEVNEEGTEAAAATAFMGYSGGAPPDIVEYFYADHPFIFIIMDSKTNTFLFMGKVQNPL